MRHPISLTVYHKLFLQFKSACTWYILCFKFSYFFGPPLRYKLFVDGIKSTVKVVVFSKANRGASAGNHFRVFDAFGIPDILHANGL